jgi:hypothetical protein
MNRDNKITEPTTTTDHKTTNLTIQTNLIKENQNKNLFKKLRIKKFKILKHNKKQLKLLKK